MILTVAAGAAFASAWTWLMHQSPPLPVAQWSSGRVYWHAAARAHADALHPALLRFLHGWHRHGTGDMKVTATLRTDADQRVLYAQGRTTPGAVITHAATAAQSAHGGRRLPDGRAVACAFDWYATPDAGAGIILAPNATAARAAEATRAAGLITGADWSGLVDPPHVELRDWRLLPPA